MVGKYSAIVQRYGTWHSPFHGEKLEDDKIVETKYGFLEKGHGHVFVG